MAVRRRFIFSVDNYSVTFECRPVCHKIRSSQVFIAVERVDDEETFRIIFRSFETTYHDRMLAINRIDKFAIGCLPLITLATT